MSNVLILEATSREKIVNVKYKVLERSLKELNTSARPKDMGQQLVTAVKINDPFTINIKCNYQQIRLIAT